MKTPKSLKKSVSPAIDGIFKYEDEHDGNLSQTAILVVSDIESRYFGKGIALIPTHIAKQLQVNNDDYITIEGTRKTYAISQLIPENEEFIDATANLPPIQIDSNIRKNAGVVLGDKIRLFKVEPHPAERVFFAEQESNDTDKITPNIERLRRYLHNQILRKGDEVWIPTNSIGSIITTDTPEQADKYSFHPDVYYLIFQISPVGTNYPCLIINEKTEIFFRKNPVIDLKTIYDEPLYLSDVGGLAQEKQQLKELVGFKIFQNETLIRSNLKWASAILLTGQSGTGKSLLARAIVNEFPVCAFIINAPELIGDKPQSTPAELTKIIDEAIRCSPSIIIIDEVEALATNREDLKFDAISRNIVVSTLLLMDRIAQTPEIVLIGTTNKADAIDQAFRAPHRFSKEIKFFTPKTNEREEIMNLLIKKSPLLDLQLIDCHKVADEANGFTGADLNFLIQEAFINHLKEIDLYDLFISTPLKYAVIKEKIHVVTQNFVNVLKAKLIKPAILRSYLVETPKVTFADVGGLDDAKRTLEENIKFPQVFPDLFLKFNARRTHGILLHGPPGCGKTLLAKALATESNMNFIYIKAAEVLNRWLGESEAAVREIFSKAKASAPCIIFFDELDAISSIRGIEGNVHSDRVTAQILTEIDGLEDLKNVICIGATNRLDIIDPAIMRPGRLYPTIKIDIPNEKEREEIFKIHVKNKPLDKDVDLKELSNLSPGMGGANIEEICHQATVLTIRENVDIIIGKVKGPAPTRISRVNFLKSIEEIKKKTRFGSEPANPRLYA